MSEKSGKSAAFTIFPAIDLRDGRVVRLRHGDLRQMTVYGSDPAAVARRWAGCGSEWLHVVNLDGAFEEQSAANWRKLPDVVAAGARVQFGGGLRSLPDVERALDLGVSRVIFGTAALDKPQLLETAVSRYGPDRVVAGIDARDGWVRTRGWLKETSVAAADLGHQMKSLGLHMVIYTDIGRDGTLAGPNLVATAQLAQDTGLQVIASGGVNSLADVTQAYNLLSSGITGLIIGRALYDGRVDLSQAIRTVRR